MKIFLLLIFLPFIGLAQHVSNQQANSESSTDPISFQQRSAPDILLFPFFHGVASGDPLSDAVVIWTRLSTADSGVLPVNWRMATDTALSNVIASGTFLTDVARDYTVKVDVSGLSPNTWYYYEFEYLGRRSLIGRTRTAPIGEMDSLRFAVVSCSNYQAGYFNAYARIAERNDIDAVIHLGDYIYEYETGGYGFDSGIGREHDPDHEIITLGDYRLRHSWYKLDDDLRAVHQQYPFIAIYDDHEFANDAWTGGAENHDGSEGPWANRRSSAFQAWLEWMPIRDPLPAEPTKAYKYLPFSDLIDFIVVDTRVEGRSEQDFFDVNDPSRTMLGATQFNWLSSRLTQSTAQWKVMVNQTIMAPVEILGSIINADQWDGYAAERSRLLDTVLDNNIANFVVLTGDFHSAWVNNIPTSSGNAGVEFVATSVTSPGSPIGGGEFFVQLFNSHVRYVNLLEHGYMIMDFNSSRAQCDHIFVSSVEIPSAVEFVATSWEVADGTVGVIPSSGPSSRPGIGPDRPPVLPVNSCAIPLNPISSAVGSSSATISWDPSPGALGYRVEGREFGSTSIRGANTTLLSNTFGIFDPSTTYEWRVAASCDGANLSSSSAWASFTTLATPLRVEDIPELILYDQAPQIIGVYPMPFIDRIGLHFNVLSEAEVMLQLIDLTGKVQKVVSLGINSPGMYFEEISAGELSSGIYLLRMQIGDEFVERKIIKQ
ncbi:MAG: alkaline phosphatase D [Limisphaerales bacterium]|jgi:alkaline phosphatase D